MTRFCAAVTMKKRRASWVDKGLEYFKLSASSPGELRKNDPRKLAIARLVRRGTAVSNS